MSRRPMQRLSDLLPDAVAALGITRELETARRERSWESIVAEVVPAAAGRCELVAVRPPVLIVSARDAATAQELRLQGTVLLETFGRSADGEPLDELRVVVRPG